MIRQATNFEYIHCKGFIAEIIRTHRIKSADLRVEEGTVSVVVPKDLPRERIEKLLKDKQRWINEKLVLYREAMPVSQKEFVSGESFSYLGRNYRLKVERAPFAPVKLIQGYLIASLPSGIDESHMVRNALVRWYRTHAETKLQEKAHRYAKIVGVEPHSIGIQTFKSRWGSCSAKGAVLFNWKIIMAPNRICDYIVIHELCHLIHHDHSAKFWKEVERVLPDYAARKEWLKVNGITLEL
ncbi:M48 family metallopeptidase [Neptunomonas qingdaonensis]|uniref:YgjP-like metallopeptidase domain-containing protein n=1 Tax=Neptunomonas qingdaonensis TaxID=1045558 RepID=A0A1I2RCY4_9GAMM|nr:SprT family zinc-dependent metalloprotease [Neptunomonas qingdaonensis]SFG37339.1 hypothetical protein SAMN05216175_10617 [Neptunomonas qingdaonensis]